MSFALQLCQGYVTDSPGPCNAHVTATEALFPRAAKRLSRPNGWLSLLLVQRTGHIYTLVTCERLL
jgi:hypothetical protein